MALKEHNKLRKDHKAAKMKINKLTAKTAQNWLNAFKDKVLKGSKPDDRPHGCSESIYTHAKVDAKVKNTNIATTAWYKNSKSYNMKAGKPVDSKKATKIKAYTFT